MSIQLPNNNTLTLPDGYKRRPLPGLKEWVAALRTRKDRGAGTLCADKRYCCLGVLSELQGRLTPNGRDGVGRDVLGVGNPLITELGVSGIFPDDVHYYAADGEEMRDLAAVNDTCECGEGWEIIPAILEHLYYEDHVPIYNRIMQSSVFRLDGPEIDLTQALTDLANAVHEAPEDAVDWSLGEGLVEATLDDLIIGAYWALTEWHNGQASATYAAMCALGMVYSPGMESPDRESAAYEMINKYYEEHKQITP